MPDYCYFDEAYYQDGSTRGTAYHNYKEQARDSKTFEEIASALIEVFQPRRVLDVGCATGTIVRHLNQLGCEAYGVDVSRWAVDNREHKNVQLGSADSIPFPDSFFDLVISCHALEHIPDSVFQRSMLELCRVNSAHQFHLLPMVGTEPYTGDPESVRQELRKDPTHQQLHSREHWLLQFQRQGYTAISAPILFKNDSSNAELSTGQFFISKDPGSTAAVSSRAAKRNQSLHRRMLLDASRLSKSVSSSTVQLDGLELMQSVWGDLDYTYDPPLNLEDLDLSILIQASGRPDFIRVAYGTASLSDVGEAHLTVEPGYNLFRLSRGDFRPLRGQPVASAVERILIGGKGNGITLRVGVVDGMGRNLING